MTRSLRHLPITRLALFALLFFLAACGSIAGTTQEEPDARLPLVDMGARTYLGFTGGLYPNGNEPTALHTTAGLARARRVQPLDVDGNSDPAGKYVLLSIGMSNTTQEFCSQSGAPPCDSWTFMGTAAADSRVNHTTLTIVNGASGGQDAPTWDAPDDANYDRVRDQRLAPLGLSEKQVQVVWIKEARAQPRSALPASDADAYQLERDLANILRAVRVRYPNVQQVFLSSRTYAGYATSPLNPEPYAYESGFAVKWVVEAQIRQAESGSIVDARAGDLRYDIVAPWVAWGPYLWADGPTPRSDGLTWSVGDFQSDGTHPSRSGETKVATMLLDFFATSPFTRCWFLAAGGSC